MSDAAQKYFGYTWRDKITGFQGIATGYCTYITGCNQVCLNPGTRDGKLLDCPWIDEDRLERVDDVARVELGRVTSPGFDAPPSGTAAQSQPRGV
jgi:hypothetical protein